MSGWCPSLLGVWNGGGVWCVLLLSCPVQWCSRCPAHPTAVLVSAAVVSCAVRCRVCGVVWCVCLCCSCGGVSSVRSPLVVVVGGAIMRRAGSVGMVGGMMVEGRWCY